MVEERECIVVGAGAAGMFAAAKANALVLEKAAVPLAKVRISGGGRCNVTHACFEPKDLIQNYPRGSKELLGPFHRFGPHDTIEWFASRGVELKAENDGRMFPTTDRSETIIDCLLRGVEVRYQQKIQEIVKKDGWFYLGDYRCRKLILATGSSKQGHAWAASFGHTVVEPIPSLFTFNVPSSPLKELSGVVAPDCTVSLLGTKLKQCGPVLVTHFGFSGPAILKLSAWGARYLHEKKYNTPLEIRWRAPLPKRLRRALNEEVQRYQIEGKTTNKAEFVTCGGVALNEVDFRTMESQLCPGLHFAGEILDIDGVTGGFNFQNAWTTGYLAGS
ncbi:MAG: aminoacetone oxidase family FAD-binding enzyme [Chlamydiales bacterium]|nr:aminoacetone oxidase family FAD-binding enzyme [Chlamydiales bacterium]